MERANEPNPKFHFMKVKIAVAIRVLCIVASLRVQAAEPLDLLKRYPTILTKGDTAQPRKWEFTSADVFRLSRFTLNVGANLRIELKTSDVGIGHCSDGAVWAVV